MTIVSLVIGTILAVVSIVGRQHSSIYLMLAGFFLGLWLGVLMFDIRFDWWKLLVISVAHGVFIITITCGLAALYFYAVLGTPILSIGREMIVITLTLGSMFLLWIIIGLLNHVF